MTEPLPATIGKYEILEELGRGGFATVYRAYDPDLKRQVAIKLPHLEHINRPNFVQNFRREAATAASLNHPNIITVYEVVKEGDLAIAMALATGPSLDKVLAQRGPFRWNEFLWLFEQICAALNEAHRAGISHRDLKPGNILTDGSGRPLISDFGLSRELAAGQSQKLAGSSGGVGTIGYTAPEVLNGTPGSKESDIYSLGAIAFELLTGQRLFHDLRDHFRGTRLYAEPAFTGWPQGVPSGIAGVLNRAVADDPVERYPNALALYEALVALTPPQSVTAPIGNVTQPTALVLLPDSAPVAAATANAPERRRLGWLMPVALFGLLVALGGIGGLVVFGRPGGIAGPTDIPTVAPSAPAVVLAPTATLATSSPTPDSIATIVAATSEARGQAATIEAAVNATGAAIGATTLADSTAGAAAQSTAAADQTVTAAVRVATSDAEQAAVQTLAANATARLQAATANAQPSPTQRPANSPTARLANSPTPRPANSPTVRPASSPTPRPTSAPSPTAAAAAAAITDPGGSGSLFRGTSNLGTGGDGPATCIQGSVTRVQGSLYKNFYVQLDNRGRTLPANHDYGSGTFALCGLEAGEWGVAVYAVEDVPTSDAERVAHQVRFRATGTVGEIFFVNFRALSDPPTATAVPVPPTATPVPPGPYDGFWEGTLNGTTTTGAFSGRFAFEVRNNLVIYTASSGASCIWEDRTIAASTASGAFRHGGRASANGAIYYEVNATFSSTTSASGGLYADQNGACITDASWSATKVR